MAAEWMMRELAEGLQRLVALALPGQPPAETIALTAQAWGEALASAPIAWSEERDRVRLRRAFLRLMREAERWPLPVHLIRALPSLEDAKPAWSEPPLTEEEREQAVKMIAYIRDRLRLAERLPPPPPLPEPESFAEVVLPEAVPLPEHFRAASAPKRRRRKA